MADKKNKTDKIITAVASFILGVLIAILVAKGFGIWGEYRNAMIILEDEKCDVCTTEFESVVESIRGMEGAEALRIVKLSPYVDDGEILYKKLVEKNINVVPLILFTKDLAGSAFFAELNKNIVDIGEYYVLNPTWPVRRYVPKKGEEHIRIFTDGNVDTSPMKMIIYTAVDNAVVEERNAEGKYLLHVDGPPAAIGALAQFIPLSTHTSTSLEVPYLTVSVRAAPEVLDGIKDLLNRPNIEIKELNEDENISVVAAIMTDRPEIVARLFPGAKMFSDGIIVDRSAQILLDVYLGGEEDGNVLSELINVVSSAPDRVLVRPHYIVMPAKDGWASKTGQDGVERSVIEYCVYLNHGAGSWLGFTKVSRESCEGIENCWEDVASKLGLDVEKIENCRESKAEVLKFLANDVFGAGVVQPAILINSWYFWTPGTKELKSLACSFLSHPPENLCGGVQNGG